MSSSVCPPQACSAHVHVVDGAGGDLAGELEEHLLVPDVAAEACKDKNGMILNGKGRFRTEQEDPGHNKNVPGAYFQVQRLQQSRPVTDPISRGNWCSSLPVERSLSWRVFLTWCM